MEEQEAIGRQAAYIMSFMWADNGLNQNSRSGFRSLLAHLINFINYFCLYIKYPNSNTQLKSQV